MNDQAPLVKPRSFRSKKVDSLRGVLVPLLDVTSLDINDFVEVEVGIGGGVFDTFFTRTFEDLVRPAMGAMLRESDSVERKAEIILIFSQQGTVVTLFQEQLFQTKIL